MSANSNHIDKLIKQKLKGHRVAAPQQAWSRLNAELHTPAPVRFFWMSRIAAAVILLLFAFGSGYYFSEFNRVSNNSLAENSRPDEYLRHIDMGPKPQEMITRNPSGELFSAEQPVVSDEVKPNTQTRPENSIVAQPENILSANDESKGSETPANFSVVQDFSATEGSSAEKVDGEMLADGEMLNANNQAEEKFASAEHPESGKAVEQLQEDEKPAEGEGEMALPKDEVPVMSDEMLREMLLAGQDDLAEGMTGIREHAVASKWSIGGRVSPVYSYRNISGDAFETPSENVDAGYFDSNEEGITTIAGGISLDYQFNERLSLGSGMYLSRIGQQNNDVLAYNDPQSSEMFKLATSSGTVTINPGKFESVIAEQTASVKDSIPGDYSVNGSFVQNLDYLEVPLVLKYKVIDKKFSVNVLGGLSPGVLVNNRSYFTTEGQKFQTGTTENIESFIYNSVVGIGLEYAISRKIAFSMEPSFKYSLSPVNSGSNLRYHPYSLSVFTGISYRFD